MMKNRSGRREPRTAVEYAGSDPISFGINVLWRTTDNSVCVSRFTSRIDVGVDWDSRVVAAGRSERGAGAGRSEEGVEVGRNRGDDVGRSRGDDVCRSREGDVGASRNWEDCIGRNGDVSVGRNWEDCVGRNREAGVGRSEGGVGGAYGGEHRWRCLRIP